MKPGKTVLTGLVLCIAAAAAIGIFAVMTGGLGEFGLRILLTTLSLGAYSLTGLCCAPMLDRPGLKLLGAVGIGVSIAGAGFAVLTNWEVLSDLVLVLRGRFALLILAITLAHVALLWRIDTAHPTVRGVRWVTTGAIAVVSVLLLALIGWPESMLASWPMLISAGILDVAGTVITPILHATNKQTVVAPALDASEAVTEGEQDPIPRG
jgi:hypothetical protein